MSPSIGFRQQGTLERVVECEGAGLHSGQVCRVRVVPAARGGRVFVTARGAEIPATIEHVVSASRATTLGLPGVSDDRDDGRGDDTVSTVEHLLAALAVAGIDHARVELSGAELPALDGSARPWAALVASGGRRALEAPVEVISLDEPIVVQDGTRSIRADPAEALALDVSIDFALPSIGRQRLVAAAGDALDATWFAEQVAPARTFAVREEVEALQSVGLALGGSLENAVVFDDDGPVGGTPLRFSDECVRHKAIDLLGDLALLGRPLAARVRVERGGHALHHALVRVIAARYPA